MTRDVDGPGQTGNRVTADMLKAGSNAILGYDPAFDTGVEVGQATYEAMEEARLADRDESESVFSALS
jgi:hypothetical protein